MGLFVGVIWVMYALLVITPNSWIIVYGVIADKLPTSIKFWLGTVTTTFIVVFIMLIYILPPDKTSDKFDALWFNSFAFWDKHIFFPMCIALPVAFFVKKHPVFRMISIGAACASVFWPIFISSGISRIIIRALGYHVS